MGVTWAYAVGARALSTRWFLLIALEDVFDRWLSESINNASQEWPFFVASDAVEVVNTLIFL